MRCWNWQENPDCKSTICVGATKANVVKETQDEMSERKALIVWGGWNGHEPQQVAEIIDEVLRANGFATEVSDTLDAFLDKEKLLGLSLIVPVWTMGKISGE